LAYLAETAEHRKPEGGGVANFEDGGLHVNRIGEGNGEGCDDVKFCGEAATNADEKGYAVCSDDERVTQSGLMILQYCKPDPMPLHIPRPHS